MKTDLYIRLKEEAKTCLRIAENMEFEHGPEFERHMRLYYLLSEAALEIKRISDETT